MRIVNPRGIHLRERARQEVGLLLVIALECHTLARPYQRLEHRDDRCRIDDLTAPMGRDPGKLLVLGRAPSGPNSSRGATVRAAAHRAPRSCGGLQREMKVTVALHVT